MASSTPKTPAAKPERAATPARAAKAERPPTAGGHESKPAPAAAPEASSAVKRDEAGVVTGKRSAKVGATAKPGSDMVRLKDIVDTVAAATGAKKPEAKKMVEAVLAAIGAGLAAKSVLVVPPLGKLRVAKSTGSVLTLKLRLADASRAAGLALADDEEDS